MDEKELKEIFEKLEQQHSAFPLAGRTSLYGNNKSPLRLHSLNHQSWRCFYYFPTVQYFFWGFVWRFGEKIVPLPHKPY